MNSRRKGKRGELELARWLSERGHKARRGQQYSGADGTADVVGLPGVHIECKRVEQFGPARLEEALKQSARDAYADSLRAGEYQLVTVWHRTNRTDWKVTMPAEEFLKLYERSMRDDRGIHPDRAR